MTGGTSPIPITVFTGFLGAGKTSVILSLLPKLPPGYKAVLLKNEYGDIEVDSKLANESSLSGVSEILNGCMCCVLVGQMQTALLEIRDKFRPDRILIECSGSAFPATLAFQIREIEKQTEGDLKLDAIVTVIDAENFVGYEDESPTARMQASYTDIILINKWEHVSERQLDEVIDHLNTLNDSTPKIKCQGRNGVDPNLIFGLQSKLFLDPSSIDEKDKAHHDEVETATLYSGGSLEKHSHNHEEHECSNCINHSSNNHSQVHKGLEREVLARALQSLSKENTWRVKGFLRLTDNDSTTSSVYILNWAFGRYELSAVKPESARTVHVLLRLQYRHVHRFEMSPQLMEPTASTYFHLPIDEEEDKDIEGYERKYLTWVAEPSTPADAPSASSSQSPPPPDPSSEAERLETLKSVLSTNDLYEILGVPKESSLEKVTLRRAYLARSRACHPDKFPDNPDATHAFQKVAVAYDVLSKPSNKRVYDTRSTDSTYDVFAMHSAGHAEETFKGVVMGVFNDFLDGDLEVIRTLLKAMNDINPSIRLGEDGINSVLVTLEAIRERALTCRTCIVALHAELSRLLEVQQAFKELSYFDILGRTRLTIQLTRITLGLPIALERALGDQALPIITCLPHLRIHHDHATPTPSEFNPPLTRSALLLHFAWIVSAIFTSKSSPSPPLFSPVDQPGVLMFLMFLAFLSKTLSFYHDIWNSSA
ncbi:hypothetical protein NP233_g4872 [Leucocoprinus birnbaumii]|uniref:J domain-containing protein n=1 Tax=Leucocoprinus birnbaumii TaxID=56174 RepID=A0AAD5VTZ7_9AGAR|nr:hypothetical protein NP233_g4872 [Leucocoprinus birnbaumii]